MTPQRTFQQTAGESAPGGFEKAFPGIPPALPFSKGGGHGGDSDGTVAKYFLVVILLFLLQTSFGGLLAHYTIHPASFYLQFVADLIPYSWAKTWHLQLAIFWIATTWVGTAIYLAPIIGGTEPPRQGMLVQVLFVAILFVAGGSLLGEIAGIKGFLGDWWFWLGHQGWEFLELGRIWQILLFIGLISWLFIVYRPAGRLFLRTGYRPSPRNDPGDPRPHDHPPRGPSPGLFPLQDLPPFESRGDQRRRVGVGPAGNQVVRGVPQESASSASSQQMGQG